MPLYFRNLAGNTNLGPLPHFLRHPFQNKPGCNKVVSCQYRRVREIIWKGARDHMEGCERSYGRVREIIWKGARDHMEGCERSYGRVREIIWKGARDHMEGCERSYGRVREIIWKGARDHGWPEKHRVSKILVLLGVVDQSRCHNGRKPENIQWLSLSVGNQ